MHLLPALVELNSGMLLLAFVLLGIVWLACGSPNRSEAHAPRGKHAHLPVGRLTSR